ncbi:MAG: hypothetical protein WC728_16175 [Elusimicrobiota bacterium]
MTIKKLLFLASYFLAICVLGNPKTTFDQAGVSKDIASADETPPGPNW